MKDSASLSPCPCCGAPVIESPSNWKICPECGWEDDPLQRRDPDYAGGTNEKSLSDARLAIGKSDTPRQLDYPLLCLPGFGGFMVVREVEDLERSRGILWRNGFFHGLELVDRQGRHLEVCRAGIVRPKSGLGCWLALVLDFPHQGIPASDLSGAS